MHAIVMEGKTLSTGGVVAIRNVKNPVLAAKLVLEKVTEIRHKQHNTILFIDSVDPL